MEERHCLETVGKAIESRLLFFCFWPFLKLVSTPRHSVEEFRQEIGRMEVSREWRSMSLWIL